MVSGRPTMQGEHFCHPNAQGFPVCGGGQGPGDQCEREGETAGVAAEGRREAAERASESSEGEGAVRPDHVGLRQRHRTGESVTC
jgi:hypothetical protein